MEQQPALNANPGFMKKNKKLIGIVISVLLGVIIWNLPPSQGLNVHGIHVLATVVFLIVGLIFEIMGMGPLCMLWVVFLIASGLEKPAVALNGFVDETAWLILGAFLIGQAAVKTNLAKRIAYKIMGLAGDSYTRITIALYVTGWVLGAVIPSGTARMAVIFPIFIALLLAFKAEPDSRESLDLMLQVKWAFSTGGPSVAWLTGSAVNPIIMSALTKITGETVSWGQWALWMIVPTITIAPLMWWSTSWLTKAKPKVEGGMEQVKKDLNSLGPVTRDEKVAAIFMCLAVILWAISRFINVGPGWIAMGVGLCMFLPGVNLLKNKDLKELDWNMFLFVGAAVSLAAVVSEAKLDVWSVKVLLDPLIGPLSTLGATGTYAGIWWFGFLVHFIIPSGTATAAAVAPLTLTYAVSHGLDPVVVAFLTNFANRPFLFPYQIMSIMLLWGYAKPSMAKAAKVLGVQALIWFVWSMVMITYISLIIG
jgi:anion transporter